MVTSALPLPASLAASGRSKASVAKISFESALSPGYQKLSPAERSGLM